MSIHSSESEENGPAPGPAYPPTVATDRGPLPSRPVIDVDHVNADPDASHGKISGYFDSALEDIDSVSSVDLSVLSITATPEIERIRRRSVLERHRHFEPQLLHTPEIIALADLSPVSEYPASISTPLNDRTTTSHVEPDVTRWSTRDDVEIASAGPVSQTSTNVVDVASTAPLVSAAQKAAYQRKSRLHLAALFWCLFLEGWNDGSTGPMLPTAQKYYNVNFAIISLVFVLNCIGFISGAMVNVYLNDRFGFGKVMVLGAALQLSAYVILSIGGPFPLMCLAFGIAGFSLALQNAQANGFVGGLKENAEIKMSLLHASYGLGAFVAPLVATQFASRTHWYYHYFFSIGIGISNAAVQYFVFRFKRQDEIWAEEGQAPGEADNARQSKYRQILNLRVVHFLSVWALIYVGVEVTLGGWIVTFIQEKRGGGASAGYISSGFFGGLMLGRLCLMWLNKKIGERRVMFLYTFLAIQLQVTIWVVPSLFENAVAVAGIGLLLGPMYPILMNYCTEVLPRWLLTGSVGWIAGVGQAGSAVLPFVTGLLASKFGIESLQPLMVSMMSTMIVIWAFVPKARRVE
ncbi:MFS general substrate transporter [Cristinia sonorae]|uniref:MFS general substrate transporter n=1 Tax=Cristinia sonorae TaxID=1940300 RepID=A0A8K0XSJ2_9AGAR|nr:MFS general substrate transporter [Cristinia sonorae]